MSMRTNCNNLIRNRAVVAALFFILLAGSLPVQAQVRPYQDGYVWEEGSYIAPVAPDYCDPLPEDTVQLQECMSFLGSEGQASVYQEEVLPSTTAVGAGAHGMSSAYNPSNDTILFVSTNAAATSILGRIYNATTMAPVSDQFTIDQGNLDSSGPRAVYNPEVNSYLVVWQDERPSNDRSSVYGRTVDATGSFTGPDFPIVNDINVRLGDVVLDQTNDRYSVGYDHIPSGPGVKTVDFSGAVTGTASFGQPTPYMLGSSSVTYNSNLNEYWTTYVTVATFAGTKDQDERIMFSRMNAATMAPVGEPVQLSYTRPGRGLIESPKISYSAEDGAALVVWRESLRVQAGTSEIFGKTITDGLNVSDEYPVLTSTTQTGANTYGYPSNLNFNPSTNTFGLAVETGTGSVMYLEMLSSGYIVESKEVGATSTTGATNTNPGVGATSSGFISYTSTNNTTSSITPISSNFKSSPASAVSAPAATPAGPILNNTAEFATVLSRTYVMALGLSALLAVIMSVFGGYLVMSARGNGAQVSRGKEYITSSIIGMVLLMSAYLILNTVNPDLVRFDLASF